MTERWEHRGPLAGFALSRRRSLAFAGCFAWADLPNARAALKHPNPVLRFPKDHGAHLGSRIEWWYATGWLQAEGGPALMGFQVTFFRNATGLAGDLPGRLAPRHLLFAHAALTDLQTATHRHADRLARWSGQEAPDLRARASLLDADVEIGGWHFRRSGAIEASRYDTQVAGTGFAFDLQLQCRHPPLLQGDGGLSRKGPDASQVSRYTSQTQASVSGTVKLGATQLAIRDGRAWIDHEWSDAPLHPRAAGWDWIGINLADGRALMAFQVRHTDGSVLWAGGSLREADGSARHFSPEDVVWTAGRRWQSPKTRATYPVEWRLQTPMGSWRLRSLLDAQELDSRSNTGTVYWEGLSELLDASGQTRVGLGYLEMTGYAGRLVL